VLKISNTELYKIQLCYKTFCVLAAKADAFSTTSLCTFAESPLCTSAESPLHICRVPSALLQSPLCIQTETASQYIGHLSWKFSGSERLLSHNTKANGFM
jgi:hypothetical protein